MTAIGDAPGSDAVNAAFEQIRRTHGHVPESFRLLADHAPEAFLGCMGLREFVFRAPPRGISRSGQKNLFSFFSISKPAISAARGTICATRCALG
jgi:hypothetical protein